MFSLFSETVILILSSSDNITSIFPFIDTISPDVSEFVSLI